MIGCVGADVVQIDARVAEIVIRFARLTGGRGDFSARG
jgi:hypothetical protein